MEIATRCPAPAEIAIVVAHHTITAVTADAVVVDAAVVEADAVGINF